MILLFKTLRKIPNFLTWCRFKANKMEEAKEPLIKPKNTKKKLRILSYFLYSFFIIFFLIDYYRIKDRDVSSIFIMREFSLLFVARLALNFNYKYFGQSFYTLLILSMTILCAAFIDDITKFFDVLKSSEKALVILEYSVLLFFDIATFIVLGFAEVTYNKKINFKQSKTKKN